jgi:phage gp36-like protein
MAYCTQDDLLKMLPEPEMAQLTAESGDVPDEAVVAEVIAKAAAEIDSYLAVRYVLPLTEIPSQVKHLAVDMAIYHLHSRRGMMLEIRGKNYDKSLAFLKDVAAGRAEIIGATGVELPGDAGSVVEVSSSTRIFSRDEMSGF